MQEQEVTYAVAVHKAGLALAANESVNQFTQKLRDAGSYFLSQKLSLVRTEKCYSSTYMVEAYAGAAIFEVYKSGEGVQPQDRERFYAVKYARGADGKFSFDNTLTEVQRVTRFEPKTPVAKSALPVVKAKTQKCGCGKSANESSECAMKSCSMKSATTKSAEALPEVVPGWVPTAKSFWEGAL